MSWSLGVPTQNGVFTSVVARSALWDVRGVEDCYSLMTNVLSGCGMWGGDSQRLGLRQGRIALDLGERLSAY